MKQQGFRRLFWDIESSPNVVYSWSVGRRISIDYDNIIKERAIICISWKWEGERKIHSLTWDRRHNDKKMLAAFLPVINSATESVAHYGDRFDLPWVRARCVFHRLPCFPSYTTIDTVRLVRGCGNSGFYFNSARLDYLSKHLSGRGKIKTDFDLWKRVVSGDEMALRRMVRYNQTDVRRLEEVYHILQPYVTHTTHRAVLDGGEKWQCPHCGSDKAHTSRTRVTPMGIVRKQMQCRKCHHYYTISAKSFRNMKEAQTPR